MTRRQYVIAGAVLGAFMMVISTGLILLQPGIFTGGEGSVRTLLIISFAFGLPFCAAVGAILGWFWAKFFADGR